VRVAVWLVLAVCLMTGCSLQDNPRPGEVYSGNIWTPFDRKQLASKIEKADLVLVGERHGNPEDHQLQAWVLEVMCDRDAAMVVGVEWLETSAQLYCDQLSEGLISTVEFAKRVNWAQKWGHSFKLYEPIFRAVQRRKIKLLALNAPLRVVRKIARKGINSLTKAERANFPGQMRLKDPPYLEQVSAAFKGHGVKGERAKQNFVAAQIARDEAMAEGLARAIALGNGKIRQAIVFAGRGHMEFGLGLPPRLAWRLPGVKMLTIVPISDFEAAELRKNGKYPKDDQVWLVTKPPEPKPRGRLGLVLKPEADGLLVVHLRGGSPADKAGIKAGDILVKLGR
jgi:uncharacterized iron-regulated protein